MKFIYSRAGRRPSLIFFCARATAISIRKACAKISSQVQCEMSTDFARRISEAGVTRTCPPTVFAVHILAQGSGVNFFRRRGSCNIMTFDFFAIGLGLYFSRTVSMAVPCLHWTFAVSYTTVRSHSTCMNRLLLLYSSAVLKGSSRDRYGLVARDGRSQWRTLYYGTSQSEGVKRGDDHARLAY